MAIATKQLAQEGATDGQTMVWNNTLGEWEPQTPNGTATQVTSVVLDAIVGGPTVVALMTQTPGAGTYKVDFSTSIILGSNNSQADFSIFTDGTIEAASVRSVARSGGSTAGIVFPIAISGYVVTVADAQAIDIRADVDVGTVSIFERNLTLTRA